MVKRLSVAFERLGAVERAVPVEVPFTTSHGIILDADIVLDICQRACEGLLQHIVTSTKG